MSDLYTEHLVKKKQTGLDKFLKVLMIVVTVIVAMIAIVYPFGWVVVVGIVIFDYVKLPNFDLEYEYLYVNGELDVDKIMSKSKRKRVGSYDMDKVELIAPYSSHEFDYYKQNKSLKVVDYSSREENAKVFGMLVNGEKGQQMVLFEPNDVILNDMKRIAPRKVKLG